MHTELSNILDANNIFPMDVKSKKKRLFTSTGKVVWLCGLSGSGKSTIALLTKTYFENFGVLSTILDGDNLRSGINNNLSFSENDRIENIRRSAEVAKLFQENSILTICSFITPTEDIRTKVRSIIGSENLIEVYISTSITECEKRDVKGLYKKARQGEIQNFTGINSPFERPTHIDIEIRTEGRTPEECSIELIEYLNPIIFGDQP
jgi:adenylylsulfate kinase